MTNAEFIRLFTLAMRHVDRDAWTRLDYWDYRRHNTVAMPGVGYVEARHDWMLSDPCWSAALMLAKLAGEEDW